MEPTRAHRNPLLTALVALGLAVLVGGLAIGFFGVGAELERERAIVFTVKTKSFDQAVVSVVKPGDEIFTDTAGIAIGRVVSAKVSPMRVPIPDAQGGLHLRDDPVNYQLEATIEAHGRMGKGLVLLDTQVLQVGQQFSLVSQRYYIPTMVVSLDVR